MKVVQGNPVAGGWTSLAVVKVEYLAWGGSKNTKRNVEM